MKYSLLNNTVFALKMYWKARRSLIFFAGLGVVMRVAVPFTEILLPRVVIDQLTAGATPEQFIVTVGGLSALLALFTFAKRYSDPKIDENFGNVASYEYNFMTIEKQITMDYELLVNSDVKKLQDKANMAVGSNNTMAANLPRSLANLLVNILGFFLYGSVIASIKPVVLLLLIISALINWLMLMWARKYEKSTKETRSKFDRMLSYCVRRMLNREMAKDIRLFGMSGWLANVTDDLFEKKEQAEAAVANRFFVSRSSDALLILVRDGVAYAYLVLLLLGNEISLGEFVLIFAAIGMFAGWVSGILTQSSDLLRASDEMSDFRKYIDYPDSSNATSDEPLPPFESAPEILISGVSYTYPGATAPALQDVNIQIKPGERIAIVGVNGAGKSTLVKLICGLYRPQTGCVYMNGTDIATFNRDAYFSLISAVFQDIHLLSTSIAGNVSQRIPEETDRALVDECLNKAGLGAKIEALENGADTLLVRQLHDTAIELSGGEKQKLALARALYKNAPLLILDEPTAALDPIAENEAYRQYAELTRGKTSVYISHRLASTRFCDRIIFLDEQRVAEEGTHDELMKLNGKYAAMFNIQASYYREEVQHG